MQSRVMLLISLCFLIACQAAQANDVCTRTRVNLEGAAGADITVGATAIGVMANNPQRCVAVIRNTHASAPMRCMAITQGVPTSTAGVLISGGEILRLDTESREAWMCIRTTSTSPSAMVLEALP